MAPQDTALVPDSGPTVASRTAMVVGGLLIQAARRLRDDRRGAQRRARPSPTSAPRDAAAHGPTRIDQQFEPYPHVHFDDETYRGDAYPAFGWAACVATVDVDLDSGEVTVRDVVAADDVGQGHPPGPRRGPGRGRHAPGDRLRDDRGDQAPRRPLPERPPRDVHHPDRRSTRRGSTTILVEAPFSGAPHGAKGVGELPMDVGAPAVVAAIHDATGAWIHELPASPERILAALGVTPTGAGRSPVAGEPAVERRRSTSRSRRARTRARTRRPIRRSLRGPRGPAASPR